MFCSDTRSNRCLFRYLEAQAAMNGFEFLGWRDVPQSKNVSRRQLFLGVFFGQGSRPRMWANTLWAIRRTDGLSTIDYRLSRRGEHWTPGQT